MSSNIKYFTEKLLIIFINSITPSMPQQYLIDNNDQSRLIQLNLKSNR